MAVSKDKARLVLAVRAVGRLFIDKSKPWVMKELFAADDAVNAFKAEIGVEVSTKDLVAASVAKAWQRTFVDKMIRAAWVKPMRTLDGGTLGYLANDMATPFLGKILLEAKDPPHSCETIKWLLFPSRYALPAWLEPDHAEVEADAENEEDEDVEVEEEEETPAMVLLQAVQSTLQRVVAMETTLSSLVEDVTRLRESQKGISTRIGELNEKIDVASGRVHNSFKALAEVNQTVLGVHESVNAVPQFMRDAVPVLMEIENLLATNNQKLDVLTSVKELKAKIASCHTALHTIVMQSSDLSAGIDAVIDTVGEMEHGPSTTRPAPSGVPGLPEGEDGAKGTGTA